MTEATRHTPGTPCWASLMVHRLEATQSFYHELFGWDFSPGPQPLGPYVRARLDGKDVAGLGQLPRGRQAPMSWTPYLATDSTDSCAETARCSGATVAVGPLDAGDAGRLAIVADPVGAIFGMWQQGALPGTAVRGAHGTPVWHELLTVESAAVRKFYETAFGYEVEEARSPGGGSGADRVTLRIDGRPVAVVHGLGRLPQGRGSHWMISFEVDDADRAARRVTELGGRVVDAPEDGPRGRTATVADREGAMFRIVRSGG
ncbi:VOC family protein [Streptomyces clavuligerus]|uniref:Hydroxylase n=1 Tax=Streptomyces clavuligerus TaxID=1901 RepID=E2QA90_STRCL|nr:VOC family protein [Streptomyces clavuligerus]ANW17686.1 bleomycin resistance protein [Streptomyces clavuligerus]AXU12236.1 VOC family protein [Streptomyces clavuligerus]EFG09789.1 Hydroxylase [Streptomyces clavuligerus]MBY6302109.1 VOC family protein [Streptomyces clavuligerus]QCS05018.1 VOC family protein [Streptomyces clavuligerus]